MLARYAGLANKQEVITNMFRPGAILSISLSATLLAAAIVVPALAVTQSGPFYVPDSTDAYAIRGNSSNGMGVEGNSTSGPGMYGSSGRTFGIEGITTTTSTASRYAGIAGYDHSTAGYHYGVLGTSPTTGVAGYGTGPSSQGMLAQGVMVGIEATTTGSSSIGVYAHNGGSGSVAVSGTSQFGVGVRGDSHGSSGGVAVLAETDGTALPMVAFNDSFGGVMSLDSGGNMILYGSLTQGGTPHVVVRGSGPARVTYAAQTTTPAVEDAGEGRIAGGVGYVAIDAAFASTLDWRAPYSVFITPEGDSHGLYVTAKTPRGFFVRESSFGRSSIGFAYRILGKPASGSEPRLPLYTDSLKRLPRPVAAKAAAR